MNINPHVYAQFPRCMQLFIDMAHEKRFKKGEILAYSERPVDAFMLVVDGNLKRYGTCDQVSGSDHFLDHGKDILFEYVRRGDVIGEAALMLPNLATPLNHDSNVEATSDVIIASMGSIVLSRFKMSHPEAYVQLRDMVTEMTSFKLSLSRLLINEMVNLDARERIRAMLNRESKEATAVKHPDGIELRITKQDIAAKVGCSREVAGRVIKDFHENKYLFNHGKTIIVFGGEIPESASV